MDMTGEFRIPAPREVVWKALNDPAVLKQSIAGCEELEKVSDTQFAAKVTAKVGPVKARFAGRVTLSDLDPPNGYKITGEGQGGAAGFAKGGAEVRLEPDGDGTLLKYTVNAAIGGKLAQIGARLIDGAARKMADDFFSAFAGVVAGGAAPAEAPVVSEAHPAAAETPAAPPPRAAAEAGPPSPPAAESRAIKPWVWAGALIVIAILLLIYYGL
jgi:carbon monoxide dehydrogenase subunit G